MLNDLLISVFCRIKTLLTKNSALYMQLVMVSLIKLPKLPFGLTLARHCLGGGFS